MTHRSWALSGSISGYQIPRIASISASSPIDRSSGSDTVLTAIRVEADSGTPVPTRARRGEAGSATVRPKLHGKLRSSRQCKRTEDGLFAAKRVWGGLFHHGGHVPSGSMYDGFIMASTADGLNWA